MDQTAERQDPNYLMCNNDALRKAMRNLGQLYDDVLQPSGLRNSQFSILTHVGEMDEPTLKQLARELVMDVSALSHSLKPLVRDGFVRLVPNLSDGRSKHVTLTSAGRQKVAEGAKLWADAQRRLETLFGEDEAGNLRKALMTLSSPEFSKAF